jgi:hypothetical protein
MEGERGGEGTGGSLVLTPCSFLTTRTLVAMASTFIYGSFSRLSLPVFELFASIRFESCKGTP